MAIVGAGAAAMALAPMASATVVGTLATSASIGGGVTVTPDTITWNVGKDGTDFSVNTGTNLTYDGGTPVAIGDEGMLKDLVRPPASPPTILPLDAFMTINGTPVDFVLDGFTPPSPTNGTACSSLASGQTCVVDGTSPFLLQATSGTGTGGLGTEVTLTVFGTVTDGTSPDSNWIGSFSETVSNLSPGQIQAMFTGPGASTAAITTGHTGNFTAIVANTVPEPSTAFLGLSGLLMAAGLVRRRRRA